MKEKVFFLGKNSQHLNSLSTKYNLRKVKEIILKLVFISSSSLHVLSGQSGPHVKCSFACDESTLSQVIVGMEDDITSPCIFLVPGNNFLLVSGFSLFILHRLWTFFRTLLLERNKEVKIDNGMRV